MSACQHEETRHREGGGKAAAIMSVLGGQVWQRLFDRGGGANNEQLNRTEVAPRPCDSAGHTHTYTNPARATYSNRIKWAYLFISPKGSVRPAFGLFVYGLSRGEERRVRSLLKVRSRRKYRVVVMATNPRLLSRTWRKELPRENTVESLHLFVDGLVMNLSMIQWPVVCMFRGKKSHKTKEPFE